VIAFDKDTCSDFETALSKEWLETNGLGGFSSSTLVGCNTRRYHGILVAATRPPHGRMMLVNGFEEWVVLNDTRYYLSCHQYPGVIHPRGHENLIGFRLDPWPIWTYRLGTVILEKSLTMIHGQNTVILTYKLRKETAGAELILRPLLTGRDFHALHKENNSLQTQADIHNGVCAISPYPGVPTVYFHHNAKEYAAGFNWFRQMEYACEAERGLDSHEDAWSPGEFRYAITGGEDTIMVVTTEGAGYFDSTFLLNAERKRRQALLSGWEATDDVTHHLVLAADQFIVENRPTDNQAKQKSVIAGYPWFEDWGRDTLISLPGLLLVTHRYEEAAEILNTFASYTSEGIVPNRFPDATGEPEYNTVDASLWFIIAAFHYIRYTKNFDYVHEHLWDTMKSIIEHYQNGTRFHIRMDLDGLIYAGQPSTPLTWMDAKVGDNAITLRSGKAVEIQALWYNALRIMDQLGSQMGEKEAAKKWMGLAEKVWASINQQFWYEEGGYLYDVVNGQDHDATLRANQILAVSLPFESVTPDRAARIVATIEEKLLTPFGLRTLDPRDPRYVTHYTGDPAARDTAYHNGTVWPWLIGPFLTAYQKVNGKSAKGQSHIRAHLALLLTHLWEAGLGTVSEIFDADMPHEPRGCIAQAWSVGEILRVLREELGSTPAHPPVARKSEISESKKISPASR
jgi:predicted glycogen debranching enzyme